MALMIDGKRVAAGLSAMLALCSLTLQAGEQPNILLIYVDDLGYGDLSSYGHPVIETPNVDRLAAQGVKLTNYYAPAALCSPSRAGLMTGRMPYRTGIRSHIAGGSGTFLALEEVTLAESLRAAGYATALIGKWHLNSDLGSDTEPQPLDQGFDYAYGHDAFQIPTNRNPMNIYRNGVQLPQQEGFIGALYADEAIAWLGRRDASQPFFLYLSMAEPHTTIENPAAFNEKYARFTNGPIVPIPSGARIDSAFKQLLVPRGPGEYYANVAYMDTQIGRVLDWLDAEGLGRNTVVVFASDNGPVTENWFHWWEVNAHGSTGGLRGRKHLVYEGGIKVPAIIRYPGHIEAGTVSDELIVGTDIFPTLAAMAGAAVPTDRPIDGIDVSRAFAGEALGARTVAWGLPFPSVSDLEYAFRQGDWKLLLDGERTARELYDLSQDPLELFNLLDAEPERAMALQTAFEAFIGEMPPGE